MAGPNRAMFILQGKGGKDRYVPIKGMRRTEALAELRRLRKEKKFP